MDMELKDVRVLILGAGKSGVAAARFLKTHGAQPIIHDTKPADELSEEARSLWTEHRIASMSGMVPSFALEQIDLVVTSPGVGVNLISARFVDQRGGEVIGEVELAYRFMNGRIVGITGSNGKTTTTTLIGEILKNAGLKTLVGGNIGTPLIELAESTTDETWTVAELSSFQLETIKHFRTNVAVCLNVTPNHLDRYQSLEDYAEAKRRILMNQTSEDLAILNADDEIVSSWAKDAKGQVTMFSVSQELDEGLFLRGRDLVSRAGGKEKILTTRDEIFIRGLHNVENVLASLAAGLACGASPESMRETVANFKGVEHRIEFVSEIDGVKYFNDSKATSVDATLKALEALSEDDGKIVLILGGRGKRASYEPLAPLIERSVRAVVLIGEDARNIAAQLTGLCEMSHAGSMEEAVVRSSELAESGDSVLLAPACASFDMFRSFEHRGEVFKGAVQFLGQNKASAS
jgi:UDP-N-acetylmuramoylalanine--D-glutamate ligase